MTNQDKNLDKSLDKNRIEIQESQNTPEATGAAPRWEYIVHDYAEFQEALNQGGDPILLGNDIILQQGQTLNTTDRRNFLLDGQGHAIIGAPGRNSGPLMRIDDWTVVRAQNITFRDGYNKEDGGAISMSYQTTEFRGSNVTFENNDSERSGGAIYSPSYAYLTLTNARFLHNVAANNGGAIAYESTPYESGFSVKGNSLFDGNIAETGLGGAIYTSMENQVWIDPDVIFENNQAPKAPVLDGRIGIFDASNYNRQVKGTHWTAPYVVGYNNLDLSYLSGTVGEVTEPNAHCDVYQRTTDYASTQAAINQGVPWQDIVCIRIGGGFNLQPGESLVIPEGLTVFLEGEDTRGSWNSAIIRGGGGAPILYAGNRSKVSIQYLRFFDGDNQEGTVLGAGARATVTSSGRGGAIESYASELTLNDVWFEDNHAESGGALYAEGAVHITKGVFTNNTSEENGSAIEMGYRGDGSLTIDGESRIDENKSLHGAAAVALDYVSLHKLNIGADVRFYRNTAPDASEVLYILPSDQNYATANFLAREWTSPFTTGLNNVDLYYELPVLIPATVDLVGSKNPIGASNAEPVLAHFLFGLYDENGDLVATTESDEFGQFVFEGVLLEDPGLHQYTIRELEGPPDGAWDLDTHEIPVEVETQADPARPGFQVVVSVTYPDGETPQFVNTHQSETCGVIEFPELIFNTPGDYEYTIKELTKSGNGWDTDDTSYPVIIHVVDDGYGNYVATAEYPNGYPEFVDVFTGTPAHFAVSACKTAIGAAVPGGRFQFGIYDDTGKLLTTADNGPANETLSPYRDRLLDLARNEVLACSGTVYGDRATAIADSPSRQSRWTPLGHRKSRGCEASAAAVERRFRELQLRTLRNAGQ